MLSLCWGSNPEISSKGSMWGSEPSETFMSKTELLISYFLFIIDLGVEFGAKSNFFPEN